MTAEELELGRKLQEIFMPYSARRTADVLGRNGQFVHYTSAGNGLSII